MEGKGRRRGMEGGIYRCITVKVYIVYIYIHHKYVTRLYITRLLCTVV